jgi:hypothetical protein
MALDLTLAEHALRMAQRAAGTARSQTPSDLVHALRGKYGCAHGSGLSPPPGVALAPAGFDWGAAGAAAAAATAAGAPPGVATMFGPLGVGGGARRAPRGPRRRPAELGEVERAAGLDLRAKVGCERERQETDLLAQAMLNVLQVGAGEGHGGSWEWGTAWRGGGAVLLPPICRPPNLFATAPRPPPAL